MARSKEVYQVVTVGTLAHQLAQTEVICDKGMLKVAIRDMEIGEELIIVRLPDSQ